MRSPRPKVLASRIAIVASAAFLISACQQSQAVQEPAASPSPLADTRATATLLPTYTQPIFGAAVPPSPAPGGPGGPAIVGAPGAPPVGGPDVTGGASASGGAA